MQEESSQPSNKTPILPDLLNPNLKVEALAHAAKVNIVNGIVDAAQAGTALKKLAKFSEELLKDPMVKMCIMDATEKYFQGNAKKVTVFGADITKAAVYTSYDWKTAGHPVWNALDEIEKTIKACKSEIEEELKLMAKSAESNKSIHQSRAEQLDLGISPTGKSINIEGIPKLVWEPSGEVVTIEPPQKIQQFGLKYSNL